MTIQSTTRYSAARQRRRYIYTRRSETKKSPAPGPKPGGGAGAEGREAAARQGGWSKPPYLGCPQQDRRTGRRRRSGPGGANRHHY